MSERIEQITTVHLIPIGEGAALLPIPTDLADEVGLRVGDQVEIHVEGDRIVLVPRKRRAA